MMLDEWKNALIKMEKRAIEDLYQHLFCSERVQPFGKMKNADLGQRQFY